MRAPLVDRRTFLRSAGAGFLAGLAPIARAQAERVDAVFAAAFRKRDGNFGVALLSEDGALLHSLPLPDRGHDITCDARSGRCVVFARQPGTFAVVFDNSGRSAPVTIASASGRHFYGHGVFSPDGRLLYATENDFDNAAGMIGIYDATASFARIGEFSSYGVGPHEMLLMGDGRTLAIANGGIETHPDFGRAKLNLTTMQPSLVFVDRLTGALIEKQALPASMHQLSIRHMDVSHDGALWFGCQHEGPLSERPQLIGRARLGDAIELIEMPDDVLGSLRNYVGSVAANPDAGTIAVTSPQGNALVVLDASTASIVASERMVEVCGVAPDRGGFRATTGTGMTVDPQGVALSDPQHVWDNHLLRVIV